MLANREPGLWKWGFEPKTFRLADTTKWAMTNWARLRTRLVHDKLSIYRTILDQSCLETVTIVSKCMLSKLLSEFQTLHAFSPSSHPFLPNSKKDGSFPCCQDFYEHRKEGVGYCCSHAEKICSFLTFFVVIFQNFSKIVVSVMWK